MESYRDQHTVWQPHEWLVFSKDLRDQLFIALKMSRSRKVQVNNETIHATLSEVDWIILDLIHKEDGEMNYESET